MARTTIPGLTKHFNLPFSSLPITIFIIVIAVLSIFSFISFLCGSKKGKKLKSKEGGEEDVTSPTKEKKLISKLNSNISEKPLSLAKMISWRKVDAEQQRGHSLSMASSSSKSPNSNRRWKYHVFLSFRGEDTRNNFTDHLYEALKRGGFIPFRDDEELIRGKVISDELLKAIEESLISIVVLSKNYASSTWCLIELLKILESRELQGTKVLPIFYGVDPSAVRHQTGSFQEAFEKHEERFRDDTDEVQRLRNALEEVAGISGLDSTHLRETELIGKVVEEVRTKVWPELPTFTDNLVGIDSKIRHMYSLLRMELDNACFIGIWGIGGIGKTTIAEVVFENICSQFDIRCFLRNVREVSGQSGHGLIHLQRELLSHLGICGMDIQTSRQGKDRIRSLLRNRKVLLVLDDVSSTSQLESLAGNEEWFGPGSRIIVTTRDSGILTSHGISAKYDIEILNKDESLQLFCKKAFKSNQPLQTHFLKLSNDVVQFAGGLPLALEVIGSYLRGRDISRWESALSKLKKDLQFDIWKTLRISFDGLLDTEKEIFLDISCFFKGWQKDELTQILESCGFFARDGIEVLIEKSLVTLDKNGNLGMHDLLEEMGRNIVYQESPIACKRSRLWSLEDIEKVFRNNMGTESIQAMALNLSSPREACWHPEVFSKMCNLRLLIASSGLDLPLGLKCLPSGLKVLIWNNYPLKSLPLGIPLDELVHIEMPNSKINQLCIDMQSFPKLVFLYLGNSEDLTKTPNFVGIPNLTTLDLRGCINLVEVDPSIGLHKKLVEVNLEGCINLEKLPRKLEMSSLKKLHLEGCSNVRKVPEFGENMVALSDLILDGTAIVELPPSLGYLTGLHTLSLNKCKKLICLPNSFRNLKSLTVLSIMGCLRISKLPCNLAENEALQYLNTLETAVRELPSSIVHLRNLKCLYVVEVLLRSLPSLRPCLEFVDLDTCQSLESLPNLTKLLKLTELLLSNCGNLKSLPNLPPNVECVNLDNCQSLESLPILPPNAKFVGLDNCQSLESLPNLTKLLKLEGLWLSNCRSLKSLPTLPPNVGYVRLDNCQSLESLPNLTKLLKLTGLQLSNCRSLKSLPNLPPNVEYVRLDNYQSLESLPNLTKLLKLTELWLSNCRNLKSLPNLPPNVECVRLDNCQSLESLPNLTKLLKLTELWLSNCRSLKSLPTLPPNVKYVYLDNCQSLE